MDNLQGLEEALPVLHGHYQQTESKLFELPFELREKIYNAVRREYGRDPEVRNMADEQHSLENTVQDLDEPEDATDRIVMERELESHNINLNSMINVIQRKIKENTYMLRLRTERPFN